MDAEDAPPAQRWPWTDDRRGRAIELVTMCALAVAQPVYAVLGANTAELVARQVDGVAIVVFAVALLILPPGLLWLIEEAVGRVAPGALRVLHPGLLGLLAAVVAIQLVGDRPSAPAVAVLIAAVAVGVAFAWAYRRWGPVRLWLRYLSIGAVVFLVAFVALSPVRRLVVSPAIEPVAASAAGRPDVVVLVLDELPMLELLTTDGDIDAERYPGFARLAATSTWYRNATTSSAWTVLAVPSLLSGTYPTYELGPMAADYPNSVFTLLGGSHDLNVWESVTRLCSDSLCPDTGARPSVLRQVQGLLTLSGQIVRQRTSPFEEVERRMQFEASGPAASRPDQFRAFIESVQPGDRPSLDVLHVGLPHQPYLTMPSTAPHDGPDTPPGLVDGYSWLHELAAGAGRQAHVYATQATDHLLGELLDHLEASGQLDDTMLVVTADHGVAFDADLPYRAMTAENADLVGYPPLFIKYPDQRTGATSDIAAETVDIVPTIADVVGIDAPWAFDGVSLRDEAAVAESPQRFRPIWIDALAAGPDGFAVLDTVPFEERVRRNRAVIEQVAGDEALATLPGGRDLVGADVADLRVDPTSAGGATLGFGGSDRVVRPGARIPAFVLIGFDRPPAGSIAVAVDGRVVLTGAAAVIDGLQPSFWGLLPEEALPEGPHEVEVYEVLGEPGAEELRPFEVRSRG